MLHPLEYVTDALIGLTEVGYPNRTRECFGHDGDRNQTPWKKAEMEVMQLLSPVRLAERD